jgi:type IV pilus assembly protein PilV
MKIKLSKTYQAGAMLLEALIAILIFSLGILALVGMQATAINTVSDANYRITAGFLADQMIGTIWANRLAVNATANAAGVVINAPDPGFACAPCTAASGVGNAFTQAWFASGVQRDLPAASATIAVNGQAVTVTLQWLPPKDQNPHRHVVSTTIN